MKLRATQAILECLLEQGVDTVFGYPGGTILNIYDELYRYQDKIRHILTAHEQGASHAADGYARATGKVGVCVATSGPGATNLTTGIAPAHKDAFQEVDITGIAMPITKATYLVRDPNEIPDVIREAFAVAAMGRPGPVLIDLLKNVTSLDTMIDYEYLPKEEHQFHGRLAELRKRVGWDLNTPAPNREDVEKLVELIARSERPMLICGGGVVRSRADREFATLAQRLDAPVAITVMGGGGFPGGHALTTGMLGMHGSRASNIGCDNCDLLIAVGCRFSDRVATDPKDFAKQAKIVHIDIDRAEIDKNVRTDHHIIGDAKQVLRMVNERIPQYDHSAWKQFVFSHRPGPEADDGQLTPRQIIQTIRRMAPGDSIVCTDVGQHQMWSIQHFHFDYPGQLITSGGFGTMGFGLGAAIGAKMGHPEKTVLLMTGDGCFRMNGQELATVSHYDIPVIVVIFNNHTLGMVHQWQNLLYEGRFSQTDLNFAPDFIKLADAYGIRGRRVATSAEMSAALREALDGGHAYVIECVIDTDETVRPMVSAGKPITEFLLE